MALTWALYSWREPKNNSYVRLRGPDLSAALVVSIADGLAGGWAGPGDRPGMAVQAGGDLVSEDSQPAVPDPAVPDLAAPDPAGLPSAGPDRAGGVSGATMGRRRLDRQGPDRRPGQWRSGSPGSRSPCWTVTLAITPTKHVATGHLACFSTWSASVTRDAASRAAAVPPPGATLIIRGRTTKAAGRVPATWPHGAKDNDILQLRAHATLTVQSPTRATTLTVPPGGARCQ